MPLTGKNIPFFLLIIVGLLKILVVMYIFYSDCDYIMIKIQ